MVRYRIFQLSLRRAVRDLDAPVRALREAVPAQLAFQGGELRLRPEEGIICQPAHLPNLITMIYLFLN